MGNNPDWGVERGNSSPAMKELWARARTMDAERPVEWRGERGRWVPWRAIEIDDRLLPRERLDEDAIARYREAFDQLPPLLVERRRLRLIGGRHRIAAARDVSDIVPVLEREVADDGHLAELAIIDNAEHGVPHSPSERKRAARFLLERHHPDGSDPWPIARIAAIAGVDRSTLFRWVAAEKEPTDADSSQTGVSVAMQHLSSQMDQPNENEQVRDTSPTVPVRSRGDAPQRQPVAPSRGMRSSGETDERWGAVLAGMEAVVELLSELDAGELPDEALDDQITRAEAWAAMGERLTEAANTTHLRLLNEKAARESERLALAQSDG